MSVLPAVEIATPGYVLGGRYLVEAVVGQGSFGRVFRARDTETSLPVALKEFVRQRGKPDSFLRELGILFELKHPRVIDCRSLVMTGPFRYLVCEFMEAGSLRDLLRSGGTSTLGLLRLLLQAAAGVAYAHEHNVIHRDLKPENILLTRRDGDLQAKVSDFGISTIASAAEATACIGSPAYMAPEQFYDRYDARVDVYALGVLLYEVVCGRRPFNGSPAQLMVAHLRREPEYPAWLPKVLVRVMRRALAKKPERRYPSAEAFRDALTLAIDAEGDVVDRNAWPQDCVDVLGLAHTNDDVFVRRPDGVLRLDARGRLIEQQEPADDLVGADGVVLCRRGGTVTVASAQGVQTLKGIPREGRLSLSSTGAVGFVSEGGAAVVEVGGHQWIAGRGAGVTALGFVGLEQAPCIARVQENRCTLEFSGSILQVPEPIGEVFGHPGQYEVVARSAAANGRIYLVRPSGIVPALLHCGDLSCDSNTFYGVTSDGFLASINVASARIARTRWESPLVAVSAGAERFVCATRAGRVVCV